MDRHELAWAAGFFDGEGSAWAQVQKGRSTKQPFAQINQADPDGIPAVLKRFMDAVGVGTINGPKRAPGRIDLYSWVVSSRPNVERTLEALRPWLGPIKTRDFVTALARPTPDIICREPTRSRGIEDLAWAAGLYDGEGSTYLVRHSSHAGYFVVEAAITQSSDSGVPVVLSRFAEAVGPGRIYGPYPQHPPYPPVYRWKAYRRVDVEAILAVIWPWLGDVKRRQAKAALEIIRGQLPLARGNPAWGSHKTHCVHGHEYATARIRPFVSRGKNSARRDSKQCLACLRDHARKKGLEPDRE